MPRVNNLWKCLFCTTPIERGDFAILIIICQWKAHIRVELDSKLNNGTLCKFTRKKKRLKHSSSSIYRENWVPLKNEQGNFNIIPKMCSDFSPALIILGFIP